MTDRKRVACFFTAGYTELNSMKRFMRKINHNVEYIQLCPNGPRRSKREIRERKIDLIDPNQNGLTKQALIDFVLKTVAAPSFIREKYDAILIEDDKDDRFLIIQEDGTAKIDEPAWNAHKKQVTDDIHAKYTDIPVLLFYAAPEVESWFLADWDNSFGTVYKKIFAGEQNQFFSTRFRQYVQNQILTMRYRDHLEHYGYFKGKYRKLSEEIQNALVSSDSKNFIHCADDKPVRYSKRVQGEMMLENINPLVVLRRCTYFFKAGFYELQDL